jgi:heptosyltransferase-2
MRLPPCGAYLIPQNPSKQRWELNLDFANAIDPSCITSDSPPPTLDHTLTTRAETNRARVALIPLAAGLGKEWPASHWRVVSQALGDYGVRLSAFCGPDELSRLAAAVGEDIPHYEMQSIQDWVDHLLHADAVISVNTGPMHIAAALHRPLIVVDGSSTLPLWAPPGSKSISIHHQGELGCAPCHQTDANVTCCSECMALVQPSEVIAAFQRVHAASN